MLVSNTISGTRARQSKVLPSFLDHNWSDRFSSSIGYSMENIENCMR